MDDVEFEPRETADEGAGSLTFEVVASVCDRLLEELGDRDRITVRLVHEVLGGTGTFAAVADHIRSWKQGRTKYEVLRSEIRPEERERIFDAIEAVIDEVASRDRLRAQLYWSERLAAQAQELEDLYRQHQDAIDEIAHLNDLVARERRRAEAMQAERDQAYGKASEAAARASEYERQLYEVRFEAEQMKNRTIEAERLSAEAKAQADAMASVLEAERRLSQRALAERDEARQLEAEARQEAMDAIARAQEAVGEARAAVAETERVRQDREELRAQAEERIRHDAAEIRHLSNEVERARAESEAGTREIHRLYEQVASLEHRLADSQDLALHLTADLERVRAEADQLRAALQDSSSGYWNPGVGEPPPGR